MTSPSWFKYSNQGATRNKPMSPELMSMFETFLPEMGLTMDVISGGQDAKGEGARRTGSTRHDHGHAVDADFYLPDGTKLDWNNPDHMATVTQLVGKAKSAGLTGIGAGDDYMGAGRFHIGTGNPGTWGAGGKSAKTPDWLTAAYNGVPMPEGHNQNDGHDHGLGLGPTNARAQAGLPLAIPGEEEEREYMDNVLGRGQKWAHDKRSAFGEKMGLNDKQMAGIGNGLTALSQQLLRG